MPYRDGAPVAINTGDADLCPGDRLNIVALVGESGRIVQYEDRASCRRHSIPGRLKVAGEDLCFTDPADMERERRD